MQMDIGKEILVSIDCITYNHEKYIAQAIEGFLMQKTTFAYEILIHDDASTDKTPEIIREYEKKYPALIKVIYQSENQYSQGIRVDQFNLKRAEGKYAAICEGDDYWTDPDKLQKQVDYMQSHPECSACIHAASRVSGTTDKAISSLRVRRGNGNLSIEDVIEGGGNYFATNSMLYSREKVSTLPNFYDTAGVMDYPLAIYLAMQGTIHYMDEIMSVYRVSVENSWTDKEFSNTARKKQHYDNIAKSLDEVNQLTRFKYNKSIERAKTRNQFYLLMEQREFLKAINGGYQQLFWKMGFLRNFIKKRLLGVL